LIISIADCLYRGAECRSGYSREGDATNHSWLDADGHPRTNKLHIVERLTRPELGRIADEITIDDPGAYTRPWKVVEKSALAPNWEIQETSAMKTRIRTVRIRTHST